MFRYIVLHTLLHLYTHKYTDTYLLFIHNHIQYTLVIKVWVDTSVYSDRKYRKVRKVLEIMSRTSKQKVSSSIMR
jgi:hypothetical protein